MFLETDDEVHVFDLLFPVREFVKFSPFGETTIKIKGNKKEIIRYNWGKSEGLITRRTTKGSVLTSPSPFSLAFGELAAGFSSTQFISKFLSIHFVYFFSFVKLANDISGGILST